MCYKYRYKLDIRSLLYDAYTQYVFKCIKITPLLLKIRLQIKH